MDKELLVAACLHPQFKLDWIDDHNRIEAEAALKTVFTVDNIDSERSEDSQVDEDINEEKDFFLMSKNKTKNKSNKLEELDGFLKKNNSDLKSLFGYPKVMKKFIYFNTGLPSSAPVERLFSTGGNVMTVKRHNLSDDLFEKLVLLKKNNICK